MTTKDYLNPKKLSLEEVTPYLEAFEKSIEIPKAFSFESVNKVMIDKVPAYLFRFEKYENKGFNGEHFSFLVSEKEKTILGFINMDKKYYDRKLPSKAEAEKASRAFLLKLDEDLANALENQWTAIHEDSIYIDGKEILLTVMKYKCYRASENDYAWVYVGFDGSIQSFERNTKWDMAKQERFAEQWLHDSWRIKMNK